MTTMFDSFDKFDYNSLARNVGCTQKYVYQGNEWWTNCPSEICFSTEQLEKYNEGIAQRFIEMLSNQQECNGYDELYDTELNATLQFLINAVKEEFFKE